MRGTQRDNDDFCRWYLRKFGRWPDRDAGPVTMRSIRAHGIRTLVAYCSCGHSGKVAADWIPDELALFRIDHRFRCTKCGAVAYETRPDWTEMNAPGLAKFYSHNSMAGVRQP